MIHIGYIIILFLLIVLFILIKRIKGKRIEGFQVDINIGNALSIYYYEYFISLLKKEHFYYKTEDPFIKLFPDFIPFDQELSDKLENKSITYERYKNYGNDAFWTSETPEKQVIHGIMKPYMNKIMNTVFINNKLEKEVKYPIIHFRCADTPFRKHKHYYFQKYKYFKDAIKSIPKFDKIIILSCNTHLSSEQNEKSCQDYVNILKNELSQYNPKIQCGTNVDDFISMFYAPVVISTQSSFSFMAGFFGNSTYIQPNFMEDDKECEDCFNDWRGYNLPHEMVGDYHNVDKVYNLLS
jgi:hypothetical protein